MRTYRASQSTFLVCLFCIRELVRQSSQGDLRMKLTMLSGSVIKGQEVVFSQPGGTGSYSWHRYSLLTRILVLLEVRMQGL